jgi:hypothetical protein
LGCGVVGLISLLGALASACGPGVSVPTERARVPHLDVVPHWISLPTGGTTTFAAYLEQALAVGVEWTASAGLITSAGLYTAPAEVGTYQIQATYAGLTGSATAKVVATGSPAALHDAASSTCAAFPIRSTGTTWYFCDCQPGAQGGCAAGSDTADAQLCGGLGRGRCAASPLQSWSRAVSTFNGMNAGDTVALCRGGAWSTSAAASFNNPRCAAAADMRAPTNTTTCDLRDFVPTWPGTAKPIVRETSAVNLLQFWNNAQRGIRVLNLDLEGGGSGPGGTDVGQRAIAMDDNNSSFLFCNNTVNGWFHGFHIMGGANASRIDVWGNRITNVSTEGILGTATNSAIDANFFDNDGSYNVLSHVAYLDRHGVSDLSFVNNEIRRSGGSPCAGVVVVVHGQVDGINIENNIVDGGSSAGGGCWGIAVDDGQYPDAAWFRNLSIRRNLVVNVGTTAIAVAEAPGAVIENNIIVAPASTSAIAAPSHAHRTSPADDAMTGAVIRNNTVYLPSGSAIVNGYEGTGYVIANNAVYYSGSGGTCFVTQLAAGAYAFVGNNACHGGTWGTSYDATFHVTDDPLFTSPPSNFTPRVGSPLLGAGNASRAPTYDFDLKARPSSPSIGALER